MTSDRAIAERQSRLEILRQLNAEGEGLSEGSQAVLRGLDDPAHVLPALSGALASLIEVEEKFIPAVEAALGRSLHAIVLKNGALATEIIATVKARNFGRTTLIAPELSGTAPAASNKRPSGALAWSTEKIHAPANLESIVRHLLGEVALVDDLEQAQRLKKEFPALAFATLAGEFVSVKGVIYGGRINGENNSLLTRKAQIASLAAEHRALLDEQQNLRAQHDQVQRRLDTATDRLAEIRAQHQVARGDHSATALQVSAIEREWHEASRKVDALGWEKTTLNQQLTSSSERVAQLESEAAMQREFLADGRGRQVVLQSTVEATRLRDEQLAEQLSDLRFAVVTERQRNEGLRSSRQPMAARQTELMELIAARRADIANYQARLELQSAETAAAEHAIEENGAQLSGSESAVAKIAEKRAARLAEVNMLETGLRARRKALSDLHDDRGKEEVRQTQMQLKIENVVEHVRRRYQIDLRDFVPDSYAFTKTFRAQVKQRGKTEPDIAADDAEAFDESQLREIIDQLTRQLDAMGPINIEAVHEYDELEERHAFLEAQNNDLIASRRELLDVIARINQTTEKLFAETFAQVRVNFREMFAELFGGGRADLTLIDENDALNCGIDIIAKPPGKQLQTA
jgi:chromosome segregation protein